MKYYIKYTFVVSILFVALNVMGQDVKVYQTFDEFQPLLQQKNDTTYIINFWATWCKPCVEELPEFQKINTKFKDQKFKMILVSMDFDTQLNSKVKPFVRDNKIDAEVILLADTKQYKWIDKVNENWGGSIPATVIYNKDFYTFVERTMSFDELDDIITKNIIK